jgi:mRNA-degrading endonuclease RelE of RelBE toxin-antitoxin system
LRKCSGRIASAWRVDFALSARREFHQLNDRAKAEAKKAIADLAEDPFPDESIPLRENPGFYRIRFNRDAYRILYGVSEKQGKVITQRVRPRRSAYYGLEKV